MLYAALDVSFRMVAVCTINRDGKVKLARSVPSDVTGHRALSARVWRADHQVGLGGHADAAPHLSASRGRLGRRLQRLAVACHEALLFIALQHSAGRASLKSG